MGVNCYIKVPKDVRVKDVAQVMGIAAGLKPSRMIFSHGNGWAAQVKGTDVEVTNGCPSMVRIILRAVDNDLIDGDRNHFCFYHYESENPRHFIMNPPSTPFWIAVGMRTINFFGGTMDFNDCDMNECNRSRARQFKHNNPSNDKPWYDFQEAMMKVKPLHKKDLERCAKYAAY